MVLVTFTVVVLRYAFSTGRIWLQDSVTYMHALVFLLGAGYTLKHGGHVRVDIVYRALSQRGRAWVDLLGTLLLLFPVGVFIVWISWEYVAASWSVREGARLSGGLPWTYLLKSAIIAMAALLLVQGVSLLIRNALILAGHPEAAPADEAPDREL
ncbi:TRAP transporter small permease subunit [Ectothiorhodospiraceae bacterium 2226]|nr:TRAP transporter small permease subunit [Ectothiorhodospiraceae bacterium 2226]